MVNGVEINMDGGSLRGQRPNESRAVTRQEQAPQRPATTAAASVPPKPTAVHSSKSASKPSKKKFLLPTLLVIVAAVLLFGAYYFFSSKQDLTVGVDGSKYQAVFLSNGQVYFGKLQAFNNESVKLTDIYYLQGDQTSSNTSDSKNPPTTAIESTNVKLIKLGSEIHGPMDEMVLVKDQILFYENLKSDSKVAQTIDKSKKGGDF